MKENKQNRTVGMSGVTMNNSSISNSTIIGGNSDADVGIFDAEMKNTHLDGLTIADKKSPIAVPINNPEIKSFVQKTLSSPYFIGVVLIAIEETTLGNIYKYIISLI
jgi:hypothetical protein